jgi:hypothetical protein
MVGFINDLMRYFTNGRIFNDPKEGFELSKQEFLK